MPTVFTAIFGNYDDLKEPEVITPGWRYLCFTDQPLKSKTWEIIHRPMHPEGETRTARYYKIMFHRHIDAELSIWVDASFTISVNLDEWMKQHFKDPVTCIKHPVRDCIYKEVVACIKLRKDASTLLRKQATNYRAMGVPSNSGLISSGIIMRKMNQQAIDLCDIWYQQVQLYSSRDQVAFAYAAWRLPNFHTIEWDYRNGTEFRFTPHLHKRNIVL